VLTGQPGAGKSAVLARAALGVEAEQGGPGLAFHARAATIGDFLTALADLTGINPPASADELVTSLADLPGQSPVPVVVDALDEAASEGTGGRSPRRWPSWRCCLGCGSPWPLG
jgi:hypothetical protein